MIGTFGKCPGCGLPRRLNANGKCTDCRPVPTKGPRTPKKPKIGLRKKNYTESIIENNKYYHAAIILNRDKNKGSCRCEECNEPIPRPKGINVSHIIAGSANKALYRDLENHKILCRTCEQNWTTGDRSTMKIYPETEEIRIRLTNKYYQNKPKKING